MDAYSELGVTKDASKETIKRAYRRKAQKVHPDKPEGDAAKFTALTKAYDILSDDARRASYDATGQDSGSGPSIESQALAEIAKLFLAMVDRGDVEHTNFIKEIAQQVKVDEKNKNNQIIDIRRSIVKREKAMKRIKHKGVGMNALEAILNADIDARKRGIEQINAKLLLHAEIQRVLKEYEYRADEGGSQYAQQSAFMAAFARPV